MCVCACCSFDHLERKKNKQLHCSIVNHVTHTFFCPSVFFSLSLSLIFFCFISFSFFSSFALFLSLSLFFQHIHIRKSLQQKNNERKLFKEKKKTKRTLLTDKQKDFHLLAICFTDSIFTL